MGHEWNEAGPATAASLPEATALERVTAAHRAVGADDLGEVVQARLEETGVFPGAFDALKWRFQQERTARLALEQELEDARRLVGQGPFIVVKADSLNAIADGGEIHFKLAHGNGVTRHMIPTLLSLAWQSITEAQPEPVSGSQGDTVRLPGSCPGDGCQGCAGCAESSQSAEKPQDWAWEPHDTRYDQD